MRSRIANLEADLRGPTVAPTRPAMDRLNQTMPAGGFGGASNGGEFGGGGSPRLGGGSSISSSRIEAMDLSRTQDLTQYLRPQSSRRSGGDRPTSTFG
eukprot:UC1_evm1s558